jgi:hypothetical protein
MWNTDLTHMPEDDSLKGNYMLSDYPEPWTVSTWIIYLLVLGCYFGVLYVLSAAERINYGESNDD